MTGFLLVLLLNFMFALAGNYLCLIGLERLDLGFHFSKPVEDGWRIAVVALVVGLLDTAWTLLTGYRLSFNPLAVGIVHGLLLKLLFKKQITGDATVLAVLVYFMLHGGVMYAIGAV